MTAAPVVEEKGYRCPRCGGVRAWYVPRGSSWTTPRYECGCGWWCPAQEYDGGGRDG